MGASPTFLREIQVYGAGTSEWLVHFAMEPQLSLHHLEAVGWVQAQAGFEIVRPASRHAMLFACHGGRGEVWAEGRWQICPQGWAYLAPIGQPCAYRTIATDTWHCCWVLSRPAGPVQVSQPSLVLADAHRLHTAIEGLHEESAGPGDATVLQNWIELVAALAHRICAPQAQRRSRLRPLWAAVTADLRRPWNLDELTRHAGVSQETLRHLCHQESGRSPMEQVTHLRLRHAASLLLSTSLSVAEVAAQVGYRNPFAFSTAFKRVWGVSPSRYSVQVEGDAEGRAA